MKKTSDIAICVLIMTSLSVLTLLSSPAVKRYVPTEPLAAAIEHHLMRTRGIELKAVGDTDGFQITLCLESQVDLKFSELRKEFEGTILRPVNAEHCTAKRAEGVFGQYTDNTQYFGSDGKQAFYYELVDVRCAATDLCYVDIDSFGNSDTYKMTFAGKGWSMVQRTGRGVYE